MPNPEADTYRQHERIASIDGLRGIAVSMVVLYHGWLLMFAHGIPPSKIHMNLFDRVFERGYLGVSLFLVLSGFCLSYPALQRRAGAERQWFVPSIFFARRCLRILPAYYAALFLCLLAGVFLAGRLPGLEVTHARSLPSFLSHLALVQNLTPYDRSINAPFWSLGLEWQWYLLFPIVLLMGIRYPRATGVALLAAACITLAGKLGQGNTLFIPPARLFEFYIGIVCARLAVTQIIPGRARLLSAAFLAVALAEATGTGLRPVHEMVVRMGLHEPLYGVAFGCLLLLGYRAGSVRHALSWRPLSTLGVASYSIYLVHYPIVQAIDLYAPTSIRHSGVTMTLAVCGGVATGISFYFLVERPSLSRAVSRALSPILRRAFQPLDAIWLRTESIVFGPSLTTNSVEQAMPVTSEV
ncbi:MAG: acyltransferase family protein [Chloroflexota bacterium]